MVCAGGRFGCLRAGTKRDDVVGVDGEVPSCFSVDKPGQLHDRTPSRVENGPFDVFGIAVDQVTVSGHDDYLRRGACGPLLALGRAHRVKLSRQGRLGVGRHGSVLPRQSESVQEAIASSARFGEPRAIRTSGWYGGRRSNAERHELKTARERAEEKREAKLELVREQVQSGSLVIRKMTEEERRQYPRRAASPKHPAQR